MTHLLIGEVAARAGVSTPTIRYYERIGLLKPPTRSTTGYRRYTEAAIRELHFIRKAQGLGFSLDEIGEILTLTRAGQAPCSRVLDLARHHVAAVDEKIRQWTRFRDQLAHEIGKWDAEGDPACQGLCQIIVEAEEASGDSLVSPHVERPSKGKHRPPR